MGSQGTYKEGVGEADAVHAQDALALPIGTREIQVPVGDPAQLLPGPVRQQDPRETRRQQKEQGIANARGNRGL